MDYSTYRTFLAELLAEGKTTGPNQSPFHIEVATLNQKRMDRLDKRGVLIPELAEFAKGFAKKYTFLTLTEGWCGDAAQIVPIIQKVVELSPNIEHRLVLRDQHLEIMDRYLTDGGRSIPKTIVIDTETGEEIGDWGPRPKEAQQLMLDYKYQPEPKPPYPEFHLTLHTWYAKDKTLSTQREFLKAMREWEKVGA